jgi:hypothetical protein
MGGLVSLTCRSIPPGKMPLLWMLRETCVAAARNEIPANQLIVHYYGD